MPIALNNPSDVTMKPFFPFFLNEGIAIFYCKNDLDVDLGKGIGHGVCWFGATHLDFHYWLCIYRRCAAMRLLHLHYKYLGSLLEKQ
jgi:hypothetical protein